MMFLMLKSQLYSQMFMIFFQVIATSFYGITCHLVKFSVIKMMTHHKYTTLSGNIVTLKTSAHFFLLSLALILTHFKFQFVECPETCAVLSVL